MSAETARAPVERLLSTAADEPYRIARLYPAKVLRVLLDDARERHRAERDSHLQAYTRAGMYFAISGLFLNAVLKLLVDKPPSTTAGPLYWVFTAFALIVLSLLVSACLLTLLALRDRVGRLSVDPGSWMKQIEEELIPSYETAGVTGEHLDTSLEAYMQQMIVGTLARAVAHNSASNDRCGQRFYRVNRWLFIALVCLVIDTALYFAISKPTYPDAKDSHVEAASSAASEPTRR